MNDGSLTLNMAYVVIFILSEFPYQEVATMSPQSRVGTIAILCALTAPYALAASISLASKEPGTANNYRYTYNYTCSNGGKGMISVSSKDDSSAQKLAEVKARKVCEEL